jgi:hypothetical protein
VLASVMYGLEHALPSEALAAARFERLLRHAGNESNGSFSGLNPRWRLFDPAEHLAQRLDAAGNRSQSELDRASAAAQLARL